MGETPFQIAQRTKNLKERKQGGLIGPYVGRIYSVNPFTERANVDFYSGAKGGQGLPVLHPFLSMTSWIRCMPDEGCGVLLHNRADTRDLEIERYFQPNTSNRVEAYASAIEAYRPIQPGEIELSSRGLSQVYMSRRPLLEERGGAIREWHNQDTLEHGIKAPTHRKVGYQNTSDRIGDEDRFGVVKRPTSSINEQYIKENEEFAKEHLEVMYYEGDPSVLYDKRAGHVIDDGGDFITSDYTGNNLRKRDHYYTINSEVLLKEIDELGNMTVTLPITDAEEGFTFIIPAGNYKIQIGKDYSSVISGNRMEDVAGDNNLIIEGADKKQVSGNIGYSFSNNMVLQVTNDEVSLIDSAGNSVIMNNDSISIEGTKKVNITGSTGITIKDSSVVITGGTLTVDSKVPVTPTSRGPFCAIPFCLFTGVPHIGHIATQT